MGKNESMAAEYSVKILSTEWVDGLVALDGCTSSEPWPLENWQASFANGHQVYGLLVGPQLIGFCGILSILDELHIEKIAIAEDEHGKGWGKVLLAEVLSVGKQQGAQSVYLEVRSRNQAAISLYEYFGFKRAGLRKGYYRNPPDDAILFSLSL